MDTIYCTARRAFPWLLLLLVVMLTGCERASADASTPPPAVGTPPTPVIDGDVLPVEEPQDDGGLFDGISLPSISGNDEVEPPPDDLSLGQFQNLRFATDGQGEGQSNFPTTTEEIYAIWDYSGMGADDLFTRRWYRDDALVVEHVDILWDYLNYGSTGSVRDIYLYDYVDGIDPGHYRVELYLNGTLQQSTEFDVQ